MAAAEVSSTASPPQLPDSCSPPDAAAELNQQQLLQESPQHRRHFLGVISKVANWIATSDRNVCLFADDKSLSTLSPSVLSETCELERLALSEQLQREAIERSAAAAGQLRSAEKQANNHNERAVQVQQRPKQPTRPGCSDRHLERVIARASKEIRAAVYRMRAERRLSRGSQLNMRLSIEPGRKKPQPQQRCEQQSEEQQHPQRHRHHRSKRQHSKRRRDE